MVSFVEQKRLIIPEHQRYYSGTPTFNLVQCCVHHCFSCFIWPLYVLFVFVFWLLIIPLVPSNDFRIEKDARFVITSICLWEDSCLIYVICVFLCILVSSTYCVVFFCFVRLMSCVLNVASFSGFSIPGCTFGFL